MPTLGPPPSPVNSPSMTDASRDRALECPRCGYDLRGAVNSWRESCPIEGRCAECGLDFHWHRIFTHATHPWLIEYHWRRKPLRSLLRTFIMIVRPKRFWSSVDLSDSVHLPLIIISAMVALFLPVAFRSAGTAAQLFVDNSARTGMGWGAPRSVGPILDEVLYLSFRVHDTSGYTGFPWLVEIPQYALFWFAIAWMTATAMCYALIPVSLRRVRVRPAHIRRIAGYGVAWMIAPAALLAFIESLFLLANSAWEWGTGRWLFWIQPWEFPMTVGPVPTLPLLFAITAFVWWDCASRLYLKLPDGRLVAALLTLLGGLITLAGFTLLASMLGEYGWWVDNL